MINVENKNIFGQILKKNRQECNISQEELANLCGLDRTYISLLERGKRNATIKVLFVLCKELKIAPNLFIKQMEELIN